MSRRKKPPARRPGVTFTFEHALQEFDMTVNFDGTGKPLEAFVEYGKDAASPLGNLARDAGILISIALQRGSSLVELRDAMSHDDGLDEFGAPIDGGGNFGPAMGEAQSVIGSALAAAVREISAIAEEQQA